jgi:ribonucleotide monophosphatase NagD (HAD superfamily)
MNQGLKDKSRMIMIGDRLDTDVLMANRAGVDSCLVFTGVTLGKDHMDRILETNQTNYPTFYMQSFGIIDDATLEGKL